jgi:nucleotide-binding universal stress UspA family protein
MKEVGVIETILVPLDGSPESEAVLPVASEVAHRTGSTLVLLTSVYQPGGWGEFQFTVDLQKEARLAQQYLDTRKVELERDGLSVEARAVSGPPAQAVIDYAVARPADLVAMSTHGRSGATRWAFGSVADQVLHGSHTPLLLVRSHKPAATVQPAFRKVLVPYDGSELSEAVLPFIQEFAKAFDASIVLFHVLFPPAMAYSGFEAPTITDQLWRDLEEVARKHVGEAAEKLSDAGLSVKPIVSFGPAVDEIVAAARLEGADLIAMSTHGRSGVGRWIMGSVADAVVRRADLPVLLVRPEPSPKRNALA